MSEAGDQALPQSRAKEIKARAASWLARANAGNWNVEDQAQLEGWLSQSAANRAAYWRLEAAWAEAERLRVLRAPLSRPDATVARHSFGPVKIVAAVVMIAIVGAVGLN